MRFVWVFEGGLVAIYAYICSFCFITAMAFKLLIEVEHVNFELINLNDKEK